MAITKGKSEGGNKRGHSNMSHYDYTEEIKRAAKKVRRRDDRAAESYLREMDTDVTRIIELSKRESE